MADCAPSRFQVALSFPGEHRNRVERIAEALAASLGRNNVLYDKWHSAEFARPNLDVYLPRLYHDESKLLVCFLCKAYEKEWCGLEWRAARDLLKKKQDGRLMFLRLDDADIEGLYSIDGYLPIRDMDDDAVASEILKRLDLSNPRPAATASAFRSFTSKLPSVSSLLIGRVAEIGYLDRAWADSKVNIVQIIAPGGTGKTAVADKWFRGHVNESTIFAWSFYSHGASENRQPSSDPFFAEILSFFNITIPQGASIWAYAEAIAAHLRRERVLLIIDGLEPLQDSTGEIRDSLIKALLQELRTHNRGMVLCTTRVRIKELADDDHTRSLDLENLQPQDGACYLRELGVQGLDDELEQASKEFSNHALALTLLGTYIADFHQGDIRRRSDIRELMVDEIDTGRHAKKVMASYAWMFEGKPELDILHALGYFNRPAEPEAILLLLPQMSDLEYRAARSRLLKARLILGTDRTNQAGDLDSHPLVREYFASVMQTTARNEFEAGHTKLYEFYCKKAADKPETREELIPLFHAVYHGCQAGRYEEVRANVYRDRINRGENNFYLVRVLGQFATNLSLLANFFSVPWTRPVEALPPQARDWVCSLAAYTLQGLGRLADSVAPCRASADSAVVLGRLADEAAPFLTDAQRAHTRQHWRNAAVGSSELSQIYVNLGDLTKAHSAARRAVDCADRSQDLVERLQKRCGLAQVFHYAGDVSSAITLFREAEALQAQADPQDPILRGVEGYFACDLLIDQGKDADVFRRASLALQIAEQNDWPLGIGLAHLSLGRIRPPGSPAAQYHLDKAVDFLRRSGHESHLPRTLLARANNRDLAEVYVSAKRSGLRLYLADYHLTQARRLTSLQHLRRAETLIAETGYHRRDPELQKLCTELA
jgi:hypothetical protein